MQKAKEKLPQPHALRIEMIRAKGYSDREALELLELNDAAVLSGKIDAEVKWDSLLEYFREHRDAVKAAILEGYQFSFITIGGIKSLLSIKFRKDEQQDYQVGGASIQQLKLSADDILTLRSLVPSVQWNFVEAGTEPGTDAKEIRIELNAPNAI